MESINHREKDLRVFISEQDGDLMIDELQLEIDLKNDAEAYQGLAIKILAGAGGIMSGVLFYGFLWMAFNNHVPWLLIGIASVTAAIIIDRRVKSSILDALSLGCYVVGFAAIGLGIEHMLNSANLLILAFIIAACLTLIFAKSIILHFFSVVSICINLYAFGNVNDVPYYIHFITLVVGGAYLLVNIFEPELLTIKALNIKYEAINAGLLASFSLLLCDFCWRISITIKYPWVSSAIMIVLLIWFLKEIVEELHLQKGRLFIYALTIAILGSLIFAPAICGAILVILIGFHTQRKLALVLGIIGLIFFTGQFYYDLNYTLLVKSLIMLATGVLCFVGYFIIQKRTSHENKVS